MLSTTVIMWYIRSSELTLRIAESLCHFTNCSLFHPPPSPWQPLFYPLFDIYHIHTHICFYIPHIGDTMHYLSFSACLISLSVMPWGPTLLLQMAGCPPFSWLNNIPVHTYICVCIYVHTYIQVGAKVGLRCVYAK